MKRKLTVSIVLVFIIVTSFACRIPSTDAGAEEQLAAVEATVFALQTEVAAVELQKTEQAQPQPHSPADMETPAVQPDLPQQAYRGFVVYESGMFTAYDFNGNPLGFRSASGNENYYGSEEVSVTADAVYYSQFGDASGVYRSTSQGTERLDFINSTDPVSILVSPDGSKIAWSTSEWQETAPYARLFMADVDGGNKVLVDEIPVGEQTEMWLVFHPYRWTEDGKLLYGTGLTGIGGYILFWGYNGMYEYDPQTAWVRVLVSDQERLGLCLSSISHRVDQAGISCGEPQGVRVRNLGSGAETIFPVLPEQEVAGSIRFSTDDAWVAYVIQTQNYDDERGKVIVVPADGSRDPQVIASFNGGTFTVETWVDADRFLVTRSDFASNTSSIWLMNKDGSQIRELVGGTYIGLMP